LRATRSDRLNAYNSAFSVQDAKQSMDRIDAMKVFVAALDEGSLAAAGRKLGRSPAAVSRAVAFLEGHVGVPLLHRTTRSIKLSVFRRANLTPEPGDRRPKLTP